MSTQVKTTSHYSPQPHRTSAWAWLHGAMANRRSRNNLRTLDAHMLSDVGLSEREAQKEAKRPLWDVPGHWMK